MACPVPSLSTLTVASDDATLRLTKVAAGFARTWLFSDLSFSVSSGESIAVVGPSGSGKSTLLRCIAGLQSATGSILVNETEMVDATHDHASWVRSRLMSQVFQEPHLLEELSVRENVEFPLRFLGVEREVAAQRSETFLAKVGLIEFLDSGTETLSGGEAQRVALARALAKEAPLILADEPTASLDRKTATSVGEHLIRVAAQRDAALVVCTHDRALADRCDSVVDLVEL